jgi:hypothetical protein
LDLCGLALTRAGKAARTHPDDLDGLLGLGDDLWHGCGGWLLVGLGLGACGHRPEQDRGRHGDADRDHGAEPSGQLQAEDERLAGRVQQRRAAPARQLRGDADRAAEGVARGGGGLARDRGRQGIGQLATVDGDADAAQDRDAERAAELGAGLRDPRGRPARSGGAELTIRSVVAVNTGASPSETTSEAPARIRRSESRDPPTWVSTPRPTAARASPAPIT